MNLNQYRSELNDLLRQSALLLGGEARPVRIHWQIEQMLERLMVRRARSGVCSETPVIWLANHRRGHQVAIGIQRFDLRWEEYDIPIASVRPPRAIGIPGFWAVRNRDYRILYRLIRVLIKRERELFVEPIMSDADRTRMWDTTIGFLRRDHNDLKKYGIPQRRGVLFSGEPGNGKTMACRWLSAQCARFGLEWESVTIDEYEAACRNNEVHELFQPCGPGIILFDDFDVALRDRRKCDNPREQSTFLAEIDGMNPKHGVVYLFTSNLREEELDRAIRRPGRIDQIIHFGSPDRASRVQLMKQRWHVDITSRINVDAVAEVTEGMTFAELEELKKQLVLNLLDEGEVHWEATCKRLKSRCEVERQSIIGFANKTNDVDCQPITVAQSQH